MVFLPDREIRFSRPTHGIIGKIINGVIGADHRMEPFVQTLVMG